MEWIVVIIIRLLVPLTILRWPLLGSVLSMIADNFDVVILDFLELKEWGDYNRIDKFLDVYFALFQGYTLLSWKDRLAKKTGIFLFWYRIAGTLLFEITNAKLLLLVFPNLFEFYFLFYLIYKKIFKKNPFTTISKTLVILFALLVLKLFQEYLLHVVEFPFYPWIKDNIFSLFI